MKIHNLHALLQDKWFIHQASAHALLASLEAIFIKKGVVFKTNKKEALFSTSPIITHLDGAHKGPNTKYYVAIMDFKSPIFKYDQECGPSGTKSKATALYQLEKDPSCVGIVFDFDSGGGQVSGTAEFYDIIKSFSKPIVAYTDGSLCSAAYYIAAATQHIVANHRAEYIGSIGTMIHFVNMDGVYEKKGAKIITAYASKSTDKNRDFGNLLQGNPDSYIKNELDPITDTFIADMKAVRPALSEDVFTGKTYSPKEALAKGLIDEIGTLKTAINKVFELSKSNHHKPKNSDMGKLNIKQLPKLHAVLNLKAPLEATNKGSYFNTAQLNAIEKALAGSKPDTSKLQNQVAQFTNRIKALENQVNDSLRALKKPIAGTLSQKIATLKEVGLTLGKADAKKPTALKIKTKNKKASTIISGIDISGALHS